MYKLSEKLYYSFFKYKTIFNVKNLSDDLRTSDVKTFIIKFY